jgi:RHS repeat-associated protein
VRLNEKLGYTYDAADNLNFRTNNALVQTFSVNNLNELSTVTRSGTFTVEGTASSQATNVTVNTSNAVQYSDFTFASTNQNLSDGNNTFTAIAKDSFGNLATNVSIAYLPANSSFVYDLNGNLCTNGTRIYEYDDENELIRMTATNSFKKEYIYDGKLRLRIRKEYGWQTNSWVQTNEIHFIYDGNLIVQLRDTNNSPTLTITRGNDLSGTFQGSGGIGGLLAMTESSGTNSYYHADGNGNVTMLLNTNQAIVAKYEYDPFGNPILVSGTKAFVNSIWFSSQVYDPDTGFLHYLYRIYIPELQRWPNRDPAEELGGINLYGFVLNNPVSYIDSYGLWTATIKCKGGKYVVDLGGAKGQPYEKCVTAHEQQHIDDWKKRYGENSCQGVPDGQLPMGGTDYKDFLHDSECKAHAVARDCAKKLADGCKDAGDKATDKNYADSENKYLKDNKCPQYQK